MHITVEEIKSMDFAFDGQPFVAVRANSFDTNEYAFDAAPFFVSTEDSVVLPRYVQIGSLILQV